MPGRSTLTVSITTRDSAHRLAPMLAEVQQFADEVLVGVDQASSDGTWDVATAGADRVFAFRHGGVTAPVRMAALERARCDWILFLDDDEGMDAAFPAVLGEMLGDRRVTHWWLPRKWVTSLHPPQFLRAEPWWPDYALRLTLADPTRVWKPMQLHTGLRAIGHGGLEPRAPILHYEFTDRGEAERDAKIARYRERGQGPENDRFYVAPPDLPRAAIDPPPLRERSATPVRRPGAVVETAVEDLDARPRYPGWGAQVSVDMPGRARAGEVLLVDARARNTGALCWEPSVHGRWPDLSLAYRLRRADGTSLPDGAERARVGRDVPPGDQAWFIAKLHVPQDPGDYVVTWQMLSEFEHWFDDLGSPPAAYALTVIP